MTSIWVLQIKSDNANWLQRYLHEEGPEKSFKSKWNWTDLIFEKALLSSCVWQCGLIAPCVRFLCSHRLRLVGEKNRNLGDLEIHSLTKIRSTWEGLYCMQFLWWGMKLYFVSAVPDCWWNKSGARPHFCSEDVNLITFIS